MTALELAIGAIERSRADLAVVAIFSDERPLRGAAGRIDWRLCGRLSHLVAAGRVQGAPGEALLIPGGGGVRAPRVMGLGLGDRAALDGERWRHWLEDALARTRGLCAERVVLALPASAEALDERLDALAACAAALDGDLEVVVAPEPDDAAAAAEWLRSAGPRLRRAGLEVRSAARPQGAAPVAPIPDTGESSRAPAGRFTR